MQVYLWVAGQKGVKILEKVFIWGVCKVWFVNQDVNSGGEQRWVMVR